MPGKVHYFVMMVYTFRPELGVNYEYMVHARYKYRISMKLYLRKGLVFHFMHFSIMIGYVLVQIKHNTSQASP